MRQSTRMLVLSLGMLLVLGSSVWAAKAKHKPAAQPPVVKQVSTLENLQIAYQSESNAQARYLEFSKKAKAEGYLRAAALFEAAALSAGLHAEHHAKVLTAMKGKAKVAMLPVKTGTTQENLKAALASETEAIEKMYPAFAAQAEQEKNTDAMHDLKGAMGIASIRAGWFKQAAADVSKWKTQGAFYVCKVCGNVTDNLDFEYCAICKAPRSEFVKMM